MLNMKRLTNNDVEKELKVSESELCEPDERAIRLWERIKIIPTLWVQNQYPGNDKFWVVAAMGNRCLYFNPIECGWGWGKFQHWGRIIEYHWQDLDIHHVVFQTLFAIDNGGEG
jgi:hypothetical protein